MPRPPNVAQVLRGGQQSKEQKRGAHKGRPGSKRARRRSTHLAGGPRVRHCKKPFALPAGMLCVMMTMLSCSSSLVCKPENCTTVA